MTPDATTLVVVADGHRARLLEQPRIGGPLHDRPEWLAGLKEHHDHDGPSHITHAGDLRDRAEKAFLRDLAKRLDDINARHGFDQVILVAPPRALGHLRRSLSITVARKIVGSDAHERVDATIITLQSVVQAARLASAA
ncbi:MULTISPECIES: host attachment protein [Caulobacter]|jgi:protein required for attachment to host cells|uniref:Protein required for attachment to host cell n=1 Tax=Caulobacter vibrioides OR37 TaxID=1292034 RepID=R0EEU2_CAUVI|nr:MULTISPECIES: host attachment protein [Caulobacter]ENZ80574.1 protein required for attachment to host cell [Caulobacter vibrioides OR37]MBQ1562020.1 host attachment protein [Caulobacter sp.]